jgi:hypothetical protein
MRSRLLALLLLVSACGHLPRDAAEPKADPSTALAAKAELYRSQLPGVLDADGFPNVDKCDSTMEAGLLAAAGVPVNLVAAEDPTKPGRWYRRPVQYPECWSASESRSTISRDMLLGVLWGAWRTGDLALLERMWDYGSARNWVMGDDSVGGLHTVMNPNMVRLLADTIYALGGTNHASARLIPFDWSADILDFEAHLQVLQMALAGEVSGGLPAGALPILEAHAARSPANPLYHAVLHRYTDGDQSVAEALLLDSSAWPDNRLPTSADRCDHWVVQREPGDDWAPCDAGRTHTGGELLFIIAIMEGPAHG